ncbi:MAG: patatin-like phospholipase family protein [Bacteroidetes bacterium]|nr:patatin-like phospholipase family protein [Bacteroidota bacterium]
MAENSNREFKILSIDGGGIKGLYSSCVLQHFEENFNCLISDHFDMLCGTSTGGLIALAASLKIPMSQVTDFYRTEGPKIFPSFKKNKWFSAIFGQNVTDGDVRQIAKGGKFSDVHLRRSLTEIFGDAKIGDSHNYLCIPSYTITEARPFIFKKDHHDLTRDDKAHYVDVALATSAAPTFFPMAEISYYDHKQFIDGGVWANNPALVGLLEALRYFVGTDKEFDRVKILSVSSLSITGGKPTGLKRERSFVDWRKDLFETSMTGQSFFTDFFISQLHNMSDIPVDYCRIPSAEVSREQEDHIRLDVATPQALQLISGKGNDMGLLYRKKAEIADFFSKQKLSKIK